ncbi:hypothetical protein AB0E63_26915 [Kribbella sp. NPDC026596]|uniref:hypothetical protein n=1 Tax=Kribbella sp. NPDC026596 TaxID=3155122 RepID=UPI0033D78444
MDEEAASASLVEAARLLQWNSFRNPHPSPPRLDLTLAAEEVLAWLRDPRRFDRRNHRPGWSSVLAELQSSLDSLGPHLAGVLEAELESVRQERARGYIAIAAERQILRARLETLLGRLKERASLYAAWLDYLRLLRDSDATVEECLAARGFFWNVAATGGRDQSQLSSHLSGILTNDANQIQLSVEERLQLAERILLSTPEERHHVVWHVFTRASIDGIDLRLGDLTIFTGRWLRGLVEMEEPSPWVDIPPELRSRPAVWDFSSLPENEQFVFTRMDLGRQSLSNAPEVAAGVVDALVTLAKHRAGRRNNWTRLEGYWHAMDGEIVASSLGFKERTPRVDVVPRLDAVVDELEQVLAVAEVARFRSGEVREWAETLRWWREASNGHDAGAVLVGVRVLDLIAARVELPNWDSYANRYLQWADVRAKVLNSIQESTHSGLSPDNGLEFEDSVDHHALEQLRREIISFEAKMIQFDYISAISRLEEIERLRGSGSTGARRIRTLRARLWNADRSDEWIASLRDEWSIQVRRLSRVRDSLAHGGPTTRESIWSAAKFASGLVDTALYLSFDSALRDRDILTWHENFREDQSQWRDRFKAGLGLVPALFPTWDNE